MPHLDFTTLSSSTFSASPPSPSSSSSARLPLVLTPSSTSAASSSRRSTITSTGFWTRTRCIWGLLFLRDALGLILGSFLLTLLWQTLYLTAVTSQPATVSMDRCLLRCRTRTSSVPSPSPLRSLNTTDTTVPTASYSFDISRPPSSSLLSPPTAVGQLFTFALASTSSATSNDTPLSSSSQQSSNSSSNSSSSNSNTEEEEDCNGSLPSQTSCGLSESVGHFLFNSLAIKPLSYLAVLYDYRHTFALRFYERRRRALLLTLFLLLVAEGLFCIQLYFSLQTFYPGQIMFLLLSCAVFYDTSTWDYGLMMVAYLAPFAGAVPAMNFFFPALDRLPYTTAYYLVSYGIPVFTFTFSSICEKCLFILRIKHGDEMSVDVVVLRMYLLSQLLPLVASIRMGKDALQLIGLSTLCSCAAYVLALAWHLWQLRRLKNSEQVLRQFSIKKRATTPVIKVNFWQRRLSSLALQSSGGARGGGCSSDEEEEEEEEEDDQGRTEPNKVMSLAGEGAKSGTTGEGGIGLRRKGNLTTKRSIMRAALEVQQTDRRRIGLEEEEEDDDDDDDEGEEEDQQMKREHQQHRRKQTNKGKQRQQASLHASMVAPAPIAAIRSTIARVASAAFTPSPDLPPTSSSSASCQLPSTTAPPSSRTSSSILPAPVITTSSTSSALARGSMMITVRRVPFHLPIPLRLSSSSSVMDFMELESTLLWRRMALNLVAATLCGVGIIVAVILSRNVVISSLLVPFPLQGDVISAGSGTSGEQSGRFFITLWKRSGESSTSRSGGVNYLALYVEAEYLWYVVVVLLLMLLFMAVLDGLGLEMLLSWQKDRKQLLRLLFGLLMFYTPYFSVNLLYTLLGGDPG